MKGHPPKAVSPIARGTPVPGQGEKPQGTHAKTSTKGAGDEEQREPHKWQFKLLLALGAPLALLCFLELVLRICGVGYPTSFFLLREVNGKPAWVNNWQFGWQFFPRQVARYPHPVTMPAQKAPGTRRIFIFGESAALGTPASEYGFGRMLAALLRDQFPDEKFEVVNTSMVAINSHVIARIAKECSRRDGDLWIVYMGNNEVIGPFGAHGVIGARTPPSWWVQMNLAAKQTSLGQALDFTVQKLAGQKKLPSQWGGMQMWKETISREDPRIEKVHQLFRQNLESILQTAQKARVPAIVCTMPCNLRDCSPFASRHRNGLNADQMQQWETAFKTGNEQEQAGNYQEAILAYNQAGNLDDKHAELQFRLGRCLLASGEMTAAKQHFERAKDEDALQFRPDSRLNEIIRDVAQPRNGGTRKLADVEAVFADKTMAGAPGADLFFEHVHLTPKGNYLVARTLADAVHQVMHADGRNRKDEWPSEAECERLVGLTDWGRVELLRQVESMLKHPPFTTQSIHSNQLAELVFQRASLGQADGPAGAQSAVIAVKKEQERNPADPDLLYVLASALVKSGNLKGAENAWRDLTKLIPFADTPWLNLARALDRQDRTQEAEVAYKKALEMNWDSHEAHGDLGALLLIRGRPLEAIPHLRELVRQQPDLVSGHWVLGQAYVLAGKTKDARHELKRVLELNPEHKKAKELLQQIG